MQAGRGGHHKLAPQEELRSRDLIAFFMARKIQYKSICRPEMLQIIDQIFISYMDTLSKYIFKRVKKASKSTLVICLKKSLNLFFPHSSLQNCYISAALGFPITCHSS